MNDLENILAKFQNIVSPDFCNKLAKTVGLVQRSSSQIKGYEFAQALMVPNAFLEAQTLNSLAVRMRNINKECNITASALAQRINDQSAVKFMKHCFAKVLKEVAQSEFSGLSDLNNLTQFFTRVLIEDSTMVELHEKLSPNFKGRGGAASKAALKIDYIFDYLSEQIVDIEFCSGNTPDQTLASRITPLLKKNDIVIRDLGYFVLSRLKDIEQKEAFFISRLKCNVDVFLHKESSSALDLGKYLSKQNIHDVKLYLGSEKHPIRLVACKLSENAINKRRRDANRNAQRSGIQPSKKKLNLIEYCIFITNIPQEMLAEEHIMAFYRARWRVEMIFKNWKSCLKLHCFSGFNKERFYCLLFGRLIMVLLIGTIAPIVSCYAFGIGRELSDFKLIKYLIADHALAIALAKGNINQLINELIQDMPKRLCFDKRKRLSLRSNIKEGNGYYKRQDTSCLDIHAA